MTEFQRRLEANIRESLRFAVGEVQEDAVGHMVAGVNAVLNHPSAPAPEKHVRGYAAGMEHAAQIAEDYDQTDTLTAPKAIASAIRAVSIGASLTEPCNTGKDGLNDCFRHHITTTIGWIAFGARPGPEMQMYEEGFKAGYRRCQSDNEMDLGEEEDGLSARARKLVHKLRESVKSGAVQLADVEDAIDLIVDQAAKTEGRP